MTEKLKEYYIYNDTILEQVITLEKVDRCSDSSISSDVGTSQIIAPGETDKIIFPEDGTFKVKVDGTHTDTAYYYKAAFDSMILFAEASLCDQTGTNCLSMTSCTTEVENVAKNAISKQILYIANNSVKYSDACNQALLNISCSAQNTADILAKQEMILGTSNADKLLQIEIAEIYLQLYKEDILTEAESEVREIYNYDAIIPCIRALGIQEGTCNSEPCGIPHTASIKAVPMYTDRGVLTSIAVTYNLNPKGDTFLRVVDSNVITPGTDVSTFNGVDQTVIKSTSNDISYFIEYEYQRGNDTDILKIQVFVNALEPQWFGGESATADFVPGATIIDEASLIFDNAGVKRFQSSSSGSSSNTNTQGRYIWWITRNKVDFSPGGIGNLPIGDFASTDCSIGAPSTYAIVWKQGPVRLVDTTVVTYNFYRTCPLQDLTGQTLQYDIIQK